MANSKKRFTVERIMTMELPTRKMVYWFFLIWFGEEFCMKLSQFEIEMKKKISVFSF